MEIEIGKGKTGRRAYGFDEITIVPSRRTRDPEDVDISVQIDKFKLEIPCLASAMDGVVDVKLAIEMGKIGGLAVLNLEGLQTRYENPDEMLEKISSFSKEEATRKMQKIYEEPIKEELITKRIKEIKAGGVIACASLTPQRVEKYYKTAIDAGLDILVIQGTVVSAEHVSKTVIPLDLKKFIPQCPVPVIVGGVASYSTALHLMRTGAVGILVGVGPGAACTTRQVLGIGVPMATAISDAAAARIRHLEETGKYCFVIADGGMRTGGDIAKAIACGADLVMIGSPIAKAKEAPGRGYHWGMATFHPELPRGTRIKTEVIATLREILIGPAHENDGTLNLFGALRTSMATCGYENIKEFQKAEIMIAPAIKTEGKVEQRAQKVGMG
ncbi:MAG: GuaB3 family IMP dehydrogenase-related protein [Actinobacteria bacterium]|nr:GuaB3 family IMP dehydrogenase-related protein [Cyanobacteriota bacterium]MCL5772275.1 GuaB3 family IMP dehydrogenase-related protein [Actinomycetota bacterium]